MCNDALRNATQPEKVNRRTALNYLLGGSLFAWLASVTYPIIDYLRPPDIPEAAATSVKAAKVAEMQPSKGMIFKFGNKPGLLIQTPEGEYKAFNATCTHLDCIVQYRPDREIIWCACHNGQYDINGMNIAGPPPRPLEAFDVHVQGDDIFVSRREA